MTDFEAAYREELFDDRANEAIQHIKSLVVERRMRGLEYGGMAYGLMTAAIGLMYAGKHEGKLPDIENCRALAAKLMKATIEMLDKLEEFKE